MPSERRDERGEGRGEGRSVEISDRHIHFYCASLMVRPGGYFILLWRPLRSNTDKLCSEIPPFTLQKHTGE